MRSINSDIIVVGATFGGLACVVELLEATASSLSPPRITLVLTPNTNTKSHRQQPQKLSVSRREIKIANTNFDLITRVTHRHGLTTARLLLELCADGFKTSKKLLKIFFADNDKASRLGQVRRIATSDHEQLELDKGRDIYRLFDLEKIHTNIDDKYFKTLIGPRFDVLQSKFITDLKDRIIVIDSEITEIQSSTSVKRVKFIDGQEANADVIVFACDHEISRHFEIFRDVLVPCENKEFFYNVRSSQTSILQTYDLLITHYGNVRAWRLSETDIILSGGHFINDETKRRGFLFEQFKRAEPSLEITPHPIQPLDVTHATLPCDELPVYGSMFGESGVFVTAGFYEAGLGAEIGAGTRIAQQIFSGKSSPVDEPFKPHRHRSMGE